MSFHIILYSIFIIFYSLMFKYGRMQKKILSWLVYGSNGAWLDFMLSSWSHHWTRIYFSVQVIYVIVRTMTPCFNKPSLLSRSLVGKYSGNGKFIINKPLFTHYILTEYHLLSKFPKIFLHNSLSSIGKPHSS